MKRLIRVLYLICILMISTHALAEPQKGEGRGFFILGSYFQTPGALNVLTQSEGWGTFKDGMMIGGQGYGVVKGRLLLGGEGYAVVFSDPTGQTESNYKVSLNGGLGFFNIGYLLTEDSRWHIYPMLGIGGGAMHLGIHDTRGASFREVLDSPRRGTDLTRGLLALNFSLGTNYLIDLEQKEHKDGGLALGLRVGYILSLAKFSWTANEATVTDAPDVGLDGFYLSFMIGGGGRDQKNCD